MNQRTVFASGAGGVLAATIAGLVEYAMTDGASGWAPLVAGVAGAFAGGLITVRLAGRVTAPTPELASDPPARRIFVRRAPAEIVRDFRPEHTSLEVERLGERYVGHWLRVSGVVSDVEGNDYGGVEVEFRDMEPSISLWFSIQDPRIDEVRLLNKGDRVQAVGKIRSLTRNLITLGECEFVDHLAPADERVETAGAEGSAVSRLDPPATVSDANMANDQSFEAMGHDGRVFTGVYRVEGRELQVRDVSAGTSTAAPTGGDPDLVLARKLLLELNGRPGAVHGFAWANHGESPQIRRA